VCGTCGCGESDVRVEALTGAHIHGEGALHEHAAGHEPVSGVVEIETALLAKNDNLAGHNRTWLAERGIVALNLMSSPGSGKTSLLRRTITELAPFRPIGVIEGDQETRIDAEKIRSTGAPVVQINTGSGCHLDADMLARGLAQLRPPRGSLVFIENVGNLVCPALFDLGEAAKVVVVSVTEGEDKPLKYPYMFSVADLVVINKIDLLPYVDVQLDRLVGHCRSVNPDVRVLPLSVTTGEDFGTWCDWLRTSEPEVDGQRDGSLTAQWCERSHSSTPHK
jgi:hydrogenase nickel incorporation protein HypB